MEHVNISEVSLQRLADAYMCTDSQPFQPPQIMGPAASSLQENI